MARRMATRKSQQDGQEDPEGLGEFQPGTPGKSQKDGQDSHESSEEPEAWPGGWPLRDFQGAQGNKNRRLVRRTRERYKSLGGTPSWVKVPWSFGRLPLVFLASFLAQLVGAQEFRFFPEEFQFGGP